MRTLFSLKVLNFVRFRSNKCGFIFRRNKRRDGAICASQVAEFGEWNEIQKLEGISFQSEDIFFMETSGTAHLEHADESAPLTLEPLIGRRKKIERERKEKVSDWVNRFKYSDLW